MKKIFCLLIVLLTSFGLAGMAMADDYPSKPIKIVVPYKAGGGTDTAARLLVKYMEKEIPAKLVVINKGGAASAVGNRQVKDADPDGYTVLFNMINVWLPKLLGITEVDGNDLEPVAAAWKFALVEAASSKTPYKNLREYLEAAKSKPNTIKQAINIGAITHFASMALQGSVPGAKFKMVHIGDGATRISSVMGGHVDSTLFSTAEALPFQKSGEMKIIGVYSSHQYPGMENVPTTASVGLDVNIEPVYRLLVPKGTPQNRIDYLANAVGKAMQNKELLQKIKDMSCLPAFAKGEELKESFAKEQKMITALAKKHNLIGLKKKKKK